MFLNQREQGAHDLHLGYRDDIVKVFLAEFKSQRAGSLDCAAVSDRIGACQRNDLAGFEGGFHAGRIFRLDTDHLDIRIDQLGRQCDTSGEPAAANRYEYGIDILAGIDDFKSGRALPQKHLQVIERMDVDVTVLLLQLKAVGIGIIKTIAMEDNFGPQGFGAFNFEDWGRGWHADHGFDTETLSGKSNALCMVAGRGGDDPFFSFLICELADFVIGAPQLEGTGVLQVLWFQEYLISGQFGKIVAGNQAGLAGNSFKLAGCLIDAGNGGLLDDVTV